MTGLAGHRCSVSIDTIVTVQCLIMAVCTSDLVLVVQANAGGAPTDDMIFGLMAINALEVVTAHVDIDSLARVIQAFIQITMFDRITTAATEVTTTTVFASGNGNALRST